MSDPVQKTLATLGDRIIDARKGLGLDTPALARAMGVKQKTIESWELDRSVPRANKLQMLCGVLNVSVGWLLTGDGDGPDAEDTADTRTQIIEELSRLKLQADTLTRNISRLEKAMRKAA